MTVNQEAVRAVRNLSETNAHSQRMNASKGHDKMPSFVKQRASP